MLHKDQSTNATEAVQQPELPPITEHDLIQLVNRLDSKDAFMREETEQAIRSLGPEATAMLLHLAAEAKRGYWLRYAGGCTIGTVIFFAVVFLIDQSRLRLGGLACGLGWLVLYLGSVVAVSRRQRNVAIALALLDDIRAINSLIEACGYPDKCVKKGATKSLILLLPRLQSQNRDLLTRESRIALHQWLFSQNKACVLATLAALQHIGNQDDLVWLRRLTQRKFKAGEEDIEAAAQACLQTIQQRIDQERPQETLLRAAESPSADAGHLLRPAEWAQNSVDPQQLLRAGQGEEEDQDARS